MDGGVTDKIHVIPTAGEELQKECIAAAEDLRAARNAMIASASSRGEAKLFSLMNSVRSRKKRSTKFIQDDEVGV